MNQLDASHTKPVSLNIGLKLGGLLYMLYTAKIEHATLQSSLGFHLCFTCDGSPEVWMLPQLVFADELVLMVGMAEKLQELLHTVAEHLAPLVLRFIARKSLPEFL